MSSFFSDPNVNPSIFRRSPSKGFGCLTTLILIAVILGVEQLIALSISDRGAMQAAQAMGFTEVRVTSRTTLFPNLQGCGESDMVKFNVTGRNSSGKQQSFFVCDGLFKGATVRFP